MGNIGTIARRELSSYFNSPVAYVIIAVFLLVMGFAFAFSVYATREASLRGTFSFSNIVLLLVAPILTMRLLAEEKRTGTIELVLTAPVREVELVVGKFLASVVFLLVMLALTLWYVLILRLLGNPDPGPIVGGYIGTLLFGACFLAIGLFASSLTQNQVVSAFVSFGILLMFFLIDNVGAFAGGAVGDIVSYLSLASHLEDFTKGVVDTKDVVYYLSLIVACLFLTTSVLQARRWK